MTNQSNQQTATTTGVSLYQSDKKYLEEVQQQRRYVRGRSHALQIVIDEHREFVGANGKEQSPHHDSRT